jgi:hypothetical protein
MRIAQQEQYEGEDWWSWSVWIEAKPDELRAIDRVTYTLHPSFARPLREVTNRKSKFRLDGSGWGGFMIYARVDMKKGRTRNLKHELELWYPEGEEDEPVVIRINDPAQSDLAPQLETLRHAIVEATRDDKIVRPAPRRSAATTDSSLRVALTRPSIFSVAKGIQSWLSGNPQATVTLEKGDMRADAVTIGQVPTALGALQSGESASTVSKAPSKVSSKTSSKAQSRAPSKAVSGATSPRKSVRKKARR